VIRQLRLAQGANRDRIERVWLIDDNAIASRELVADHEGLLFVHAQGSGLLTELPAESDVSDHLYLIDPLGNLMMRYPREPDASRMVKDLKRLLRVSGAR
jgi:hypothetical protein